MEIREARLTDLGNIMALEHICFANDAWSEEVMASEISASHTYYIVGFLDGELIGYGGLSKLETSNQADIQTIRCAGSSRQASGLASSCADSFAWPTFISSGNGTPFFTAVISARMEIAISDGVLLPM